MSVAEKPMPYRIEWRGSMVVPWTLHSESLHHDESIETADEIVAELNGFSRVIVQHVIHSARTPLKRPKRARKARKLGRALR